MAKIRKYIFDYSRVIILIVLFFFFSVATDNFWSPGNWSNISVIIFQQAPFLILLAIPMTFAVILGGIDLSIGTVISFTSCTTALLLQNTHNIPLAVVVGLVLGIAFGLLNGILIAHVKINPFIATYAVYWIAKGLAYVVVDGKQVYDIGGDAFRGIFINNVWTFITITAIIVAVMAFILKKTKFGKHIYCTGSNPVAAEMSGIKTKRVIVITFTIGGLIAALTGILYIANLGSADPYIGDAFAIRAISAALIGGVVFNGGEGRMYNAVVGGFIMVILTNGLIHLGVPGVWQDFVIGVVIVLSIILEKGMHKAVSRQKAKEERAALSRSETITGKS